MSKLVRIIAHWSVTDYKCDENSRRHYHFVFEGDGKEVLGRLRPEANENTRDGVYCAHTLNCNEGSIGVACAAMWAPLKKDDIAKSVKENQTVKQWFDGLPPEQQGKDFKQNESNPGPHPVLQPQFEAMCHRIAMLCKEYRIPVTRKTVLMHGEVQKTLGIKQRGKWDIAVLPYAGLKTIEACGDYMRRLVLEAKL